MQEHVQRRKLNLTQLHKNKRNRPDKTSGRKRPRTTDVDVIAAPNADTTVTSAATGHVDASSEIEPLAITYAARSATDMEPDNDADNAIREDICHACDNDNPPACKNRKVHQIDWLQCDKCPR